MKKKLIKLKMFWNKYGLIVNTTVMIISIFLAFITNIKLFYIIALMSSITNIYLIY